MKKTEMLIMENGHPKKKYYEYIDKSELLVKICSPILDLHFFNVPFEELPFENHSDELSLDDYDTALEFLHSNNVFYVLGETRFVDFAGMALSLNELPYIEKMLARQIFNYMHKHNILVL